MRTLSAINQGRLFEGCLVTRLADADSAVNLILKGRAMYEVIAKALNLPWYLVGVIHYRESTCNFSKHLHNGDPLTARTRLVPAGRPKTGTPPFTFVESASDALQMKNLDGIGEPTIGELLLILEKYNGLGYYYKGDESPYVWSGTNVYTGGKYVADGVYDPDVFDKQLGTGTILLRMHERGIVTLRGEAVKVKIADRQTVPQAFIIRGNSWVAVRLLVTALGGTLEVVGDPDKTGGLSLAAITLPGNLKRTFALRIVNGTGFVDASDVAAFYKRSLSYDNATRTLSFGATGNAGEKAGTK